MKLFHDLEAAKAKMMGARKALGDYESLLRFVSNSGEHQKLLKEFNVAACLYLNISSLACPPPHF